jgi:hypothetical protein
LNEKMKRRTQDTKIKSNFDDAKPRRYTSITGTNDVLLGQGSYLTTSPGNLYFRHLLQERRDRYVSTCRRQLKHEIAQQIIIKISERNGRFLRQVQPSGYDVAQQVPWIEKKTWIIVDEKSVAMTIKQILRDPNFRPYGKYDQVSEDCQDNAHGASLDETFVTTDVTKARSSAPLSPFLSQAYHEANVGPRNLTTLSHNWSDQQSSQQICVDGTRPRFGFSSSAQNLQNLSDLYYRQSFRFSNDTKQLMMPITAANAYRHNFGYASSEQKLRNLTDMDSIQAYRCSNNITQLKMSNKAADTSRHNFGISMNHSDNEFSNDPSHHIDMTSSFPNTNTRLADTNVAGSFFLWHQLEKERCCCNDIINMKSANTLEVVNDLEGRNILPPACRYTDLLTEYTQRNNLRINSRENYRGTVA